MARTKYTRNLLLLLFLGTQVAPSTTFALTPESGVSAEDKTLMEREEALLKQLAGNDLTVSGANVPESAVNENIEPRAQVIAAPIITAPIITAPRNPVRPSGAVAAVALVAPRVQPLISEQVIDEQARAALAAIANVKERSAASKSQDSNSKQDLEISSSSNRAATLVEDVALDETALSQVTHLSKELGSKDIEVSNLRQELTQTQRKTISAEGRAATLAKQVETLRAKLMVTETEVERLSRVIESRNKQVITQANARSTFNNGSNLSVNKVGARTGVASPSSPNSGTNSVLRERVIVREGKVIEDLPVVIVTADKAILRMGPSLDEGRIMEVTKGIRLVVETKQGAWYRVFSPNGVRAWISAGLVQLQKGSGNTVGNT